MAGEFLVTLMNRMGRREENSEWVGLERSRRSDQKTFGSGLVSYQCLSSRWFRGALRQRKAKDPKNTAGSSALDGRSRLALDHLPESCQDHGRHDVAHQCNVRSGKRIVPSIPPQEINQSQIESVFQPTKGKRCPNEKLSRGLSLARLVQDFFDGNPNRLWRVCGRPRIDASPDLLGDEPKSLGCNFVLCRKVIIKRPETDIGLLRDFSYRSAVIPLTAMTRVAASISF